MLLFLALLAVRVFPAPCLAPNEMCEDSPVPITTAAFVLPEGQTPAAAFADGRTLKAGSEYRIVTNHGRAVVLVQAKRPAKLFKLMLAPEPHLCAMGIRIAPPLPPAGPVHQALAKGRPDPK